MEARLYDVELHAVERDEQLLGRGAGSGVVSDAMTVDGSAASCGVPSVGEFLPFPDSPGDLLTGLSVGAPPDPLGPKMMLMLPFGTVKLTFLSTG